MEQKQMNWIDIGPKVVEMKYSNCKFYKMTKQFKVDVLKCM